MSKMSSAEVMNVVGSNLSKSGKMKALYNMGLEIKDIAELMQVRYNFVYNVVSNMCKIEHSVIRTKKANDGTSKKELIIKLLKEGKTKNEVAAEVGTYYTYVFNIEKAMERAEAAVKKA